MHDESAVHQTICGDQGVVTILVIHSVRSKKGQNVALDLTKINKEFYFLQQIDNYLTCIYFTVDKGKNFKWEEFVCEFVSKYIFASYNYIVYYKIRHEA